MRSGAGGPEQEKWGAAIKVILPTFAGGGTHVNISGAAVAKQLAEPSRGRAVPRVSGVADEAQKIYAEANYEYPVKAGAHGASESSRALGTLKVDPTAAGRHRPPSRGGEQAGRQGRTSTE